MWISRPAWVLGGFREFLLFSFSLRWKCRLCPCLPVCKYRYSKHIWYFWLRAHLALGKWTSTLSVCEKSLSSSLMVTEMKMRDSWKRFRISSTSFVDSGIGEQSLSEPTHPCSLHGVPRSTVSWSLRTSCWGLEEQGGEWDSLWPLLIAKAKFQVAS